jgi:ubiquinone/menaquinone biosynthesis C-methylase UbiE
MSEEEFQLDNPMLVRWEFASEERQQKRNSIMRELIDGVNAEDLALEAVREFAPGRVLEVGCGAGELAEQLVALGIDVTAIDTSQRMVDLTRARGVKAQVADIQSLPFEDDAFDCVVAGWVLYHVVDRAHAIRECARVLRPGGRIVVATLSDENLADLWDLLGSPQVRTVSFSSANGAEQLAACFSDIETREAYGRVVFPTPDAMRAFVSADMTRAHLSVQVPDFTEPFEVRTHHTVFVAEKVG